MERQRLICVRWNLSFLFRTKAMTKVAIVLLADTESPGDMGRMANALATVQDFKDGGDEVQLIFDGAGVKWVGKLSDSNHKYHAAYQAVQDTVAGACQYCAGAFQVTEQVTSSGVPLADEHNGHPSFRRLVQDGYQIITF